MISILTGTVRLWETKWPLSPLCQNIMCVIKGRMNKQAETFERLYSLFWHGDILNVNLKLV